MKKSPFFILLFLASAGCVSQKATYENIAHSQEIFFHQELSELKKQKEDIQEEKFTINKAVEMALEYNKKFLASLEIKEIAKGKEEEAMSYFYPSLVGIGAYQYLDKQPYAGHGSNKLPVGSRNNYVLNLQLRQALFHGGAITSGYHLARMNAFMADEQVRGSEQKLIFDVCKAYFDLLLAKELFLVQKQAVETAESHLKEAKAKKAEGFASDFDILRFEVEVSNFTAEMIKQQNRISLANTQLLRLLGLPQDFPLDLVDSLSYQEYELSVDEALKMAYDHRPDLFIHNLNVFMQEDAVKIAKSQYYPKIDVLFDQKWGRPDPHVLTLDEWGNSWTARVCLEWSIFDMGRKRGKVLQESAALRQKKLQLDDLREHISLEVQQVLISLQDAKDLVRSQRMDLGRAKEGLKLAEIGYREGVKTEVEVSDALNSMTRSKNLYFIALYQHALAKLNVKLALGILDNKDAF